MSGERGVERLNAAFQLLHPAFNPVSAAMTADDTCNTGSGEDGAVGGPVCHHDRRDSPVQLGDFRQEFPSCERVPRWRD